MFSKSEIVNTTRQVQKQIEEFEEKRYNDFEQKCFKKIIAESVRNNTYCFINTHHMFYSGTSHSNEFTLSNGLKFTYNLNPKEYRKLKNKIIQKFIENLQNQYDPIRSDLGTIDDFFKCTCHKNCESLNNVCGEFCTDDCQRSECELRDSMTYCQGHGRQTKLLRLDWG